MGDINMFKSWNTFKNHILDKNWKSINLWKTVVGESDMGQDIVWVLEI